jgi:hypothetical protein
MTYWMLHQQTHPRSSTLKQIRPEIKAQYDGMRLIRLKAVGEDIGIRILEGKNLIRSHLQRRKECKYVVSA